MLMHYYRFLNNFEKSTLRKVHTTIALHQVHARWLLGYYLCFKKAIASTATIILLELNETSLHATVSIPIKEEALYLYDK